MLSFLDYLYNILVLNTERINKINKINNNRIN